jgi:ABC-type proline/glycine betaine transport system ATPase subunit
MITHDVDEAVLLSDRIVMMTNGPSATVGEILKVELERPRDRLALAEVPEYNHYRAEVVRFLHERYKNPESEEETDSSLGPDAEIETASEGKAETQDKQATESDKPVLYAVND